MSCTAHAQPRTCGGCTGCCTVMHISSIGKRAGHRCQFECSSGCAIYDTRPAQCRSDFFCLWVRDDGRIFADSDRPDRLGVVLTDTSDGQGGRSAIAAREIYQGAARKPRARALLKELAAILPVVVVSPAAGARVTLTLSGRELPTCALSVQPAISAA